MTAEPQIGYPAQHEGWQQAPTGYGDATAAPSGLSPAFAGNPQGAPSALAAPPAAVAAPPAAVPQASFSGHDPAAPSGLFAPAAADPGPPAAYGEPARAVPLQAGYPGPGLSPQAAYPEPARAVPLQAGYPGPGLSPQAAYPEPGLPPQAAYPGPGLAPQVAHAQPGFAPQATLAEPASAPQAAYAPPAFVPPPQAAYPEPAPAFPPPPQAAYPEPVAAAGPGAPGYLQPYGAAPGGVAGQGPSVGPVVVFTLLFGIFGAISAARRSDKARAVGDRGGRYWIAFGATLAGSWVVGSIAAVLLLAFGGLLTVNSTARSTTEIALQQSIVTQASFPDASGKTIKVKTASCLARSVAGSDHNGPGTYECALGLANGTIDSVLIKLEQNGRWHVTGQA